MEKPYCVLEADVVKLLTRIQMCKPPTVNIPVYKIRFSLYVKIQQIIHYVPSVPIISSKPWYLFCLWNSILHHELFEIDQSTEG